MNISFRFYYIFLVATMGIFISCESRIKLTTFSTDINTRDSNDSSISVPTMSFKNLIDGVTSSVATPILTASSLNNFNGYELEVFNDSQCSSQIGSGVVSEGGLEINNISFGTDTANIGVKHFYGIFNSANGRKSNCTDLSLKYLYLPS